jgi:hypothetical protein
VKPAIPIRNTRLIPTMSPSRPPVINVAARARVYAATIHSTDAEPAPRSAWIAGSATLTTVVSIRSMKLATIRTTIAPITPTPFAALLIDPPK